MPVVYRPFDQGPMDKMFLVVQTAGDPAAAIPVVEKSVWRIDPDQPILALRTMQEHIRQSHSGPELNLLVAAIFGGLALLLAVSGIYGVLSYAVNRRGHELGVRMALGARRLDIFRLVLGQALALTAIGLGIGLAAAILLTRYMSAMLYQVSPTDVPTFAAVCAFLALVALLASCWPARRATSFDPLDNLRAE
jgi:putative ABC transport system permease protein